MATLLKGIDAGAAVRERIAKMLEGVDITPGLAIIRVGENDGDIAYEKAAVKRCSSLRIKCEVTALAADTTDRCLKDIIRSLNKNDKVNGILILRPLPDHIDIDEIKKIIDPEKDVDCMSPINTAMLFEGNKNGFAPCTPQAVIEILDYNKIKLEGKRITIIGRSMVVGKPLSMMVLSRHATVTICHTRTHNLPGICKESDILVAAAGCAKMVTAEFVKAGQVVIDVGINSDKDGNLCGDVDFNAVEPIVSALTPVPGGVGAVTTSVLAEHVVRAALKQDGRSGGRIKYNE